MPEIAIGLTAARHLLVEGAAVYSPTGRAEHSVLSSPAICGEEILPSNGSGVMDESGITDERSLV